MSQERKRTPAFAIDIGTAYSGCVFQGADEKTFASLYGQANKEPAALLVEEKKRYIKDTISSSKTQQ